MLTRLHAYHALVRQYGWRRCLFRIAHDWKRKHGVLKRKYPAWRWKERPLASWLTRGMPGDARAYRAYREQTGVRFLFSPGSPPRPRDEWRAGPLRVTRALREGRFPYFEYLEGPLGFPRPDWFVNPFTGQRDSAERHWCDREDFEPERGDIKFIWEASRFGWAFALARAYGADPRDEYAEIFWQLLEAWMEANPPQMGPQWMCGQEIAIRILACVFACYTFWNSLATTPERVAALVTLLAGSAQRVAGNIDAARNQMNNHGSSEAVGLWTVGVLFPELEGAAGWRRLGQEVLEREARQYIFADGSYVQHSMNYQRLMLHTYLWCLRLGELNGIEFSGLVRERLTRSHELLYQLQDAETGRLPNYGPNDGALILPLNDCDYLDYKPVIGAMHYLMKGERLYEDGPWLEDLLWLFGEEAVQAPVRVMQRTSCDFPVGGYYTLRGERSWGMVRCHTYRNRPSQADMLHLDLWWDGVNVLRDAGSFSYNDPVGQWERYFVSTAAHNTVRVGGADQMVKGPRFQWFSLLRSRYLGRRSSGEIEAWEGEHYGYRRLPCRATHRRCICRVADEFWLIIDDVLGTGSEAVGLYWHLPDCEHRQEKESVVVDMAPGTCRVRVLSLAKEIERCVLRAVDEEGLRAGWHSPYYGVREPALTIRSSVRTRLPTRFVTMVELGEAVEIIEADLERVLRFGGGGQPMVAIRLEPPRAGVSPVVSVERDGKAYVWES